MKPKYAQMDESDWIWFKEKLPVFVVEDSAGIVVKNGEERVAAWVFDNYTGASVQCHLVVEKPMSLRHGIIETIAGLAFDTLDCNAIFALVPSNKEKALKLNEHIGFTELCVMKNAFATGVHSHLLELLPENCNYYQIKDRAA